MIPWLAKGLNFAQMGKFEFENESRKERSAKDKVLFVGVDWQLEVCTGDQQALQRQDILVLY